MYNVQQIAKIMGVSSNTVRRWIQSGELKAEGGGHGKAYKIWPADYEEFAVKRGYILSKRPLDCKEATDGFRGELLMELIEISKMMAVLEKRKDTILQTLERLS